MASSEQTNYYQAFEQNALSPPATTYIVEHIRMSRQRHPTPLVTKQGLQRYQQASEYVASLHLIGHAWSALSVCVPGTAQANRLSGLIQPETPDFTPQSIVDKR
jgi:hypothetical protein